MKNKTISSIFYCASMLLLGTVFSYTQTPQGKEGKNPPTVAELFKQMDANKDSNLSKAEVKGPIKDDFDTIDLDKDGFISKEEMEKAPKPEGRKPKKEN
jgi:Ca2+-binding EF-hand superfamily protein